MPLKRSTWIQIPSVYYLSTRRDRSEFAPGRLFSQVLSSVKNRSHLRNILPLAKPRPVSPLQQMRRRTFGLSWSWKRAVGISGAKARVSRKIGVPLTHYGRRRKIGAVILKAMGLDRWLEVREARRLILASQ